MNLHIVLLMAAGLGASAWPAEVPPTPTRAKLAMLKAADVLREDHSAVHLMGTDATGASCEIMIADHYMVIGFQGEKGKVLADDVFNPLWAIVEEGSEVAVDRKIEANKQRTSITVLSTIDNSAAFFSTVLNLNLGTGRKGARSEFERGMFISHRGAEDHECNLKLRIFDDRYSHSLVLPDATFNRNP